MTLTLFSSGRGHLFSLKHCCISILFSCLQWHNLPPECQLNQPEPGKCCPEPSCPAAFQIQYPPGYARQNCSAACRPKIMAKYDMVIKSINMGKKNELLLSCLYIKLTHASVVQLVECPIRYPIVPGSN